MLRMLTRRGPDGQVSPLVRVFALLIVICMVGLTAPVLVPVVRWLLSLL